MTMWRLQCDGRWVEGNGSVWDADPETAQDLRGIAGQPVPLATMAELYRPTSLTDPVWLYLAARDLLGPDAVLTGRPPQTPIGNPLSSPPGAVN